MPIAAGKVDAKPVLAAKAGGKAKWAPPALPPAFDSVDSAHVSVKKVLLIYNPVSGKKLAKKLVDPWCHRCCPPGILPTLDPNPALCRRPNKKRLRGRSLSA